MKIYNYDRDTKEFTFESEARVSPLEPGVFLIPALATKIKPPSKEGYRAVFSGSGWDLVRDYRSTSVWDKKTGERVDITELGDIDNSLTTIDPEGIQFPVFADGKWKTDEVKLSDSLSKAIRIEAAIKLKDLGSPYSSEEQKTWITQEAEARAWVSDSTSQCPMLEAMSLNRGISMKDLCEKVIKNADLFKKASGNILGLQQKQLDDLRK